MVIWWLNCKHSPVSSLELCEFWWTFLVGGGSTLEMLGMETEVLKESDDQDWLNELKGRKKVESKYFKD